MGIVTSYQMRKGSKKIGEEFDIDKSAFELSTGLEAMGLDGYAIVLGISEEDDVGASDDDGIFERNIDAKQVMKHWKSIEKITFGVFLAALKKTEFGNVKEEYLEQNFSVLKEVYKEAASKDAGLHIEAY
jgi:hypothetical protein